MKLTKQQLKQIIKEELELIFEAGGGPEPQGRGWPKPAGPDTALSPKEKLRVVADKIKENPLASADERKTYAQEAADATGKDLEWGDNWVDLVIKGGF